EGMNVDVVFAGVRNCVLGHSKLSLIDRKAARIEIDFIGRRFETRHHPCPNPCPNPCPRNLCPRNLCPRNLCPRTWLGRACASARCHLWLDLTFLVIFVASHTKKFEPASALQDVQDVAGQWERPLGNQGLQEQVRPRSGTQALCTSAQCRLADV